MVSTHKVRTHHKGECYCIPSGNDQPAPTSKFPDATTTQPEQPLEPVITSGPADAGNQVGPITKPDDQPEILGITEPLPEPAMSLMVVSNTVDDGDEEEELVRNVSSCNNPL